MDVPGAGHGRVTFGEPSRLRTGLTDSLWIMLWNVHPS